PLVAVALLSVHDRTEWAKSDRPRMDTFDVRLSLHHYDSTGRDVQVVFCLARGDRRARSHIRSQHVVPDINAPRRFQTGVIQSFAAIDGDPPIQLFSLFVARSDVRSLRNGLWRVRGDLATSLPKAFRGMLTHGRTGSLDAAESGRRRLR
ncbi:MAG: hypothetical protein KDA60_10850, partial [Planctomycetales bacterium]|nr:hypothetical protein [Planctomycetales bacterium]